MLVDHSRLVSEGSQATRLAKRKYGISTYPVWIQNLK